MSEFDEKVAKKFIALNKSASDRDKPFNLTLIGVANLLRAKKCFYTGKELNDNNLSIDRVDNKLGYVTGNVVACRKDINQAKNQLSIEDIIRMADKLKKHQARRKA